MQGTVQDKEQLISWLEQETPIRSPSEDIFDFSIIARRIARLLKAKKMRTIGVVGSYGSGKTSLLNLTEHYLLHHESDGCSEGSEPNALFSGEIIVCRVDGWGRTKGSIAQQILAIALENTKTSVDCLSIIQLPANYSRAIGAMKWIGGPVLEALLHASYDPLAQITKLDRILAAAQLRLVIFLEDLDRNTSDEIIRDEMPALLDRLRAMRNISFVLAIGTEQQYSQILVRICDHVEAIT